MCELVGECHSLAMISCSRHSSRWHTSPRSQADVAVRPFPFFPRILEYAVCLFLIPFVFSSCTMVRGELELWGNPLHFPNSQSLLVTLWWPLCFPVLFQVVCLQSLLVSARRTRALTRTDLDTHADSSLAQVDRIKRSHTFMVAELLA